jgi:hypothetical protein
MIVTTILIGTIIYDEKSPKCSKQISEDNLDNSSPMSNHVTPCAIYNSIGLGPYQGGGTRPARPTPRSVFESLKRKVALKTVLAIETAKIAAAMPMLGEAGTQELMALLASEDASADADIANLRKDAERIAREEAAARNTRPMQFPLSKAAPKVLQSEIERRLERGHCPPLELLAEQAIRQAYAEGRL